MNDISKDFEFERHDDKIYIPGIDFGGGHSPLVIASATLDAYNQKEIWKLPGHMVWTDQVHPFHWQATEYWQVLIHLGKARIVHKESPGRKWKQLLDDWKNHWLIGKSPD